MFDDWKDQDERTTPNNRPILGVNGDETRRPDITTQINQAPVPTTPYYSDMTLPPPPLVRESAARERMRKRRVKGRRAGGEWAWVIIAFAMLGVVITLLLRCCQRPLMPAATLPI
jgi:hypothetical protein